MSDGGSAGTAQREPLGFCGDGSGLRSDSVSDGGCRWGGVVMVGVGVMGAA